MLPLPKKTPSDIAQMLRHASLAALIPAILVLSPLVGWFLGKWVGGWIHFPRQGALVGVLLGFIAGVRETITLIRRINAEMR